MRITRIVPLTALAAAIVCSCLFQAPRAGAADSDAVPAIIDNGFAAWAKKGYATYAFDIWKKDGLLDDLRKPAALTAYFKNLDRTLGSYKTYEIVATKHVGASSLIVYLSVNFEHAPVYGRFLVYQTGKDWVVQNIDFSMKPEALMPWLAFAGEDYSQ
jgi:hypothetical protein